MSEPTDKEKQKARELFYCLRPECQAHNDNCSACGERISSVATLLHEHAREARREIAEKHTRCKNCGRCFCHHSDQSLKDISPTLAEYQKHIAELEAQS
jgi:uncharacterized protein with PIN domain